LHQIDFGWGSTPDLTPIGSLQLPRPLAGFWGAISKVKERRGGGKGKGERDGKEGTPKIFYLD